MRYTTIIDIRHMAVYKNENARLIYLHLCLAAGYHDDDRDLIVVSIRNLAARLGMTLSATRHAVAQLEKVGLLEHTASCWRVKKWVDEKPITSRKKEAQETANEAKRKQVEQERRAQEERQEAEHRRREEIRNADKTPFELYYEQKVKEAEAGDAEAAAIVEARKSMYESIIKNKK